MNLLLLKKWNDSLRTNDTRLLINIYRQSIIMRIIYNERDNTLLQISADGRDKRLMAQDRNVSA